VQIGALQALGQHRGAGVGRKVLRAQDRIGGAGPTGHLGAQPLDERGGGVVQEGQAAHVQFEVGGDPVGEVGDVAADLTGRMQNLAPAHHQHPGNRGMRADSGPLLELDRHGRQPARPPAQHERIHAPAGAGQFVLQQQMQILQPGRGQHVEQGRPAPLPAAHLTLAGRPAVRSRVPLHTAGDEIRLAHPPRGLADGPLEDMHG
jgi:hypothetical protein